MKKQIEQLIDRLADKRLTGRDHLGKVLRWKVASSRYGMIQFEPGDLVRFAGYSNKYGTWICPMPKQSPTFEPFQVKERGDCFEILGHPILIGDVMEQMYGPTDNDIIKFYELWKHAAGEFNDQEGWIKLGFTKSIQEIAECEWERIDCPDLPCLHCDEDRIDHVQIPKDNATYELFKLLLALDLPK